MTNDELTHLRTKLKSGEYDGVDIMRAWIALDELIALRVAVESAPVVEWYGYESSFPDNQNLVGQQVRLVVVLR